jgi:hypothetical protein
LRTSKSNLSKEVAQLVELISANKDAIGPDELKVGAEVLSLVISNVTSDDLVELQKESVLRIIDDLACGAPLLKTKALGLVVSNNKPQFFESDRTTPVAGNVVVSARLIKKDLLEKWQAGEKGVEISDLDVNAAILLCVHRLALLRNSHRKPTR